MFVHHDLVSRTARALSLSAIEQAKSGHTSFPMAMADLGYLLFFEIMNHHPRQSKWLNRDRLALSSGHGSMFLYSFLHLCGYSIRLEDIKRFRQLNSITPGHPEFGVTDGVECTTGPLGQGVANAVGMALAEKILAAQLNTDSHPIIDHYTYSICGDGDLMEGVAMEAISFAGHYRLDKLILFYDYNRITIDGSIDITYSDKVKEKFEAQNWFVQEVDGHNLNELNQAIAFAKKSNRCNLIICNTIAGKGAANWESKHQIHGNPMKKEDYDASFEQLKISRFTVPQEFTTIQSELLEKSERSYHSWLKLFESWKNSYPDKFKLLSNMQNPDTQTLLNLLDQINENSEIASRQMNGLILNQLSQFMPALCGGSADLAGSNNCKLADSNYISAENFNARNIHFGIREHGMAAIANGMAYHGVLRPFVATFLVFSDYMRPSVRLAALSHLPIIYIWTHDSFYVGEDGPTHHPVEQIPSLRLIPNLWVFRPADFDELKAIWKLIVQTINRPVALCLSRQKLPIIDRNIYSQVNNAKYGAYIIKKAINPIALILATGSELSLALKTIEQSKYKDQIQVVSILSMELLDFAPDEYKEELMPAHIEKRIAIEAARTDMWYKYIGIKGMTIGKENFSRSAPDNDLATDFGFTETSCLTQIESYLEI